MPPRPKRLDAQRWFLTYAQADHIDIDELADFIHALAPGWLEIVQEHHQDDGIHYHIVVCFDDRFQGPLTVFDFDGHHPNWKVIKNASLDLTNRRHYIRKGLRSEEEQHTIKDHKKKACDYIIDPDTRGAVPPYVATTGRLDWGSILREATDKSSFLELVRINQPKEWVLRNDQIVKYAEKEYATAPEPEQVYAVDSFVVPPEVDQWCREVFTEPRPRRPKTLLLVGPSRLGKTVWAKSLGRYSYMQGMWHSDKFDDTVDYLIMDDFSFAYFHGMRKALWGAQEVFTSTDKYRKGYHRWGKPMIWICQEEHNPFTAFNDAGRAVLPLEEHAWYKANCIEVHVTQPFYREHPDYVAN